MHKTSSVIRTEFAAAISQIAKERKIEVESIHEAIREALVSAYRKEFGLDEEFYYFVKLNTDNGESRIFRAPTTKKNEETGEALEWDEKKAEDVTPAGFGRIAAQTAKQVILQKIRESEKDQILADYQDRVGEIVSALILRMDGKKVVLDLGRGYGWMPPQEQMRGEFYRVNSRITVLIKEIADTPKGRTIIVSRADAHLVSKLFEREVPEVASKAVEIALIAREAGVRTKLAVRSTQSGVDPVGACVGQRGVRVQEIIRELNNEKLDIIPYSDDMKLLLQGALAPAEGLGLEIDLAKKQVVVISPDDQLSLVIGRGGQNVRLAAKLTGFRITVKSAAGKIQSKVTGKEEYEIDTFGGLETTTRELLIENKLTTLGDLERFTDKWQAFDIDQAQKQLLAQKVAEYKKELELSSENYLKRVAAKAKAEESKASLSSAA